MKPERSHLLDLMEEEKLEQICDKYHVSQMIIFESAIHSDFDPNKSDIDILVSFKTMTPTEHADAYFGLLEKLEELFVRSVDLLEEKVVKIRILKRALMNQELLYSLLMTWKKGIQGIFK